MGRKRTEEMPMTGDEIIPRLNRLIEKRWRGGSEKELAEAAGIDQRQLYRLRTGRTGDPRWSTIEKLLKAVNADLCDLHNA